MDVCLWRMLCAVRQVSASEPYRMWRVWAWSQSFENQQALAHYGLSPLGGWVGVALAGRWGWWWGYDAYLWGSKCDCRNSSYFKHIKWRTTWLLFVCIWTFFPAFNLLQFPHTIECARQVSLFRCHLLSPSPGLCLCYMVYIFSIDDLGCLFQLGAGQLRGLNLPGSYSNKLPVDWYLHPPHHLR
jgi:hypothetical protein